MLNKVAMRSTNTPILIQLVSMTSFVASFFPHYCRTPNYYLSIARTRLLICLYVRHKCAYFYTFAYLSQFLQGLFVITDPVTIVFCSSTISSKAEGKDGWYCCCRSGYPIIAKYPQWSGCHKASRNTHFSASVERWAYHHWAAQTNLFI